MDTRIAETTAALLDLVCAGTGGTNVGSRGQVKASNSSQELMHRWIGAYNFMNSHQLPPLQAVLVRARSVLSAPGAARLGSAIGT
jgi:hypothetical protein